MSQKVKNYHFTVNAEIKKIKTVTYLKKMNVCWFIGTSWEFFVQNLRKIGDKKCLGR